MPSTAVHAFAPQFPALHGSSDTAQDGPVSARSSTGGLVRRTAQRLAVVLLTIAALVGFASPAGATLISPSGATGPSAVHQGTCEYLPVWGDLRVTVGAPIVFARNNRSGYSNDWQYVRYSVSLIDTASGAVVQKTGFTGATVAWDNSAARFAGQTSFRANWRGNYRAMFTIEWLDTAGRTVLGRAYQRVDSYVYYTNGVGPLSPVSSCAKGL
jgi:hypothetical protein